MTPLQSSNVSSSLEQEVESGLVMRMLGLHLVILVLGELLSILHMAQILYP